MADGSPHRIPNFPWLITFVVMTLLVVTILLRGTDDESEFGSSPVQSGSLVQSNDMEVSSIDTPSRFVTTIRRPSGPPTIKLQQADPQGRVGSIACSTCHSVRDPDFANRTPADLEQFHQNMPIAHGTLACYSCHNAEDTDTLRLADSTAVDYTDVMTLCAQCHGSQARDYEHGAHGGMTGYWDLNRGPRARNNCIDCHDPHVPAFPSMQPTFKPRDRFLSPTSETGHE